MVASCDCTLLLVRSRRPKCGFLILLSFEKEGLPGTKSSTTCLHSMRLSYVNSFEFVFMCLLSCDLSESWTPQCIFVLSTTQVNVLHPLNRPANPAAFPIKWSSTYITSLSLPLTICTKTTLLVLNKTPKLVDN